MSEVIREAITEYIEKKRNDPEFQQRLKNRIKEDKLILERLKNG